MDLSCDFLTICADKKLQQKEAAGTTVILCSAERFRVLGLQRHFRITYHKRMAMKTVTEDEGTNQEDEGTLSDVALIVDVADFMK